MKVMHLGKAIDIHFYQYALQYRDRVTGNLDGKVFDDNLTTAENSRAARDFINDSYAGSGYDDVSLPHVVWVKRISKAKAQKLLDDCCINMIYHHEVSRWVDQ